METMISYMMDVMKSDFTNIKNMMKDTIDKKKGRWYNTIDGYRNELGITWETLLSMGRKTLKNVIRIYDTDKWKEGLRKKH